MRKFFTFLLSAAVAVLSSWGSACVGAVIPNVRALAPQAVSGPVSLAAVVSRGDTEWGEWYQIGTASFPDALVSMARYIVSNGGDVWTDFDQPFAVESRVSADGTLGQLRFKNVFKNKDIIVDFNKVTSVAVMTSQSIGYTNIIGAGYENAYDDYSLYAHGTYLPAAGRLDFSSSMLLISPNMGWSMGDWSMSFDGFQVGEFTVSRDGAEQYGRFVSSATDNVTFNITMGQGVAGYRVVPDADSLDAGTLGLLYGKDPDVEVAYTQHDTPTVSVAVPNTRNVVGFIPVNADGEAMAGISFVYLYRNVPAVGNWTPLGQGVIKERLYVNLVVPDERRGQYRDPDSQYDSYTFPLMEYAVDIEQDADNPGMYRLKNPFANHPWASDFSTYYPQPEDYYLVIDATDPDQVLVPMTVLPLVFDTASTLDPVVYSRGWAQAEQGVIPSPIVCGSLVDNRVTMPSLSMVPYTYYLHPGVYGDCDLEIQLPGYIDYTIGWDGDGIPALTDEAASIVVGRIAPTITSIDYAVFPSGMVADDNHAELAAMVADGDPSVAVYRAEVNGASAVTLSVPYADVPFGRSYFVAVPRDADGVAHQGIVSAAPVSKTLPVEQWNHLGKAQLLHNAIYCIFFENPGVDHIECDAYECPYQAGLYYLEEPWSVYGDLYDASSATPVFISLRNESSAIITADICGETLSSVYTGVVPSTYYGQVFLEPISVGTVWYGSDDAMEIDFSSTVVSRIMDKENQNPMDGAWAADTFTVLLPGASDSKGETSSVGAGIQVEYTPVEYYDLQGIRVARPSHGVFIRRQGGMVTKVAL